MKWLITGGCGFIGRNLVQALVREGGHYLRIVDNLSVGSREDLAQVCSFVELDATALNPKSSVVNFHHPSQSSEHNFRSCQKSLKVTSNSSNTTVELVIGDILNEELAINATSKIDVIVHLAANTGIGPSVENPRFDCMNNVIGTFNYLEAARRNQVSRFIFASSGAAVGECQPPIHEELAPHPVSPYGASKLAGEAYCSAYYRTFGLKTVVLRFGNVYGPGSYHKNSVVAKFIKQTLNGESCEIYGDGNQTRDFIYIEDLIQAILLSAKTALGCEVFQIATHEETTVNEIARIIKKIAERELGTKVNIIYSSYRVGDVRRNFSDITKAKKMLLFEPRYDLKEGLQKTFKYFQRLLN